MKNHLKSVLDDARTILNPALLRIDRPIIMVARSETDMNVRCSDVRARNNRTTAVFAGGAFERNPGSGGGL